MENSSRDTSKKFIWIGVQPLFDTHLPYYHDPSHKPFLERNRVSVSIGHQGNWLPFMLKKFQVHWVGCYDGQLREIEADSRSRTKHIVWKANGSGAGINHSFPSYLAALQKGTSEHHRRHFCLPASWGGQQPQVRGYSQCPGARTGKEKYCLCRMKSGLSGKQKTAAQSCWPRHLIIYTVENVYNYVLRISLWLLRATVTSYLHLLT